MGGFDSDNCTTASEPSYHEDPDDLGASYLEDLRLAELCSCATPERRQSTDNGDDEQVSGWSGGTSSATATTSPETGSSQSSRTLLPLGSGDVVVARKRLRCKTKVSQSGPPDEKSLDFVDGFFILSHPLYRRYFKLSPARRRLVSKKVSQQKYRLFRQLKTEGEVEVYGALVSAPAGADHADLIRDIETALYNGLARDSQREDDVRGYALGQLGRSAAINADMDGGQSTLRLSRLPAVLLTYIGDYGLVDPASLSKKSSTAGERSAPASQAECLATCQAMDLDDLLEVLKDHPVVKSLSEALVEMGRKTVETVRTDHWAASVELCTGSLRKGECLRVHGHLWVQLKGTTIDLSHFSILDKKLPFVNWKALHFLGGTSHRSQSNAWSGAYYVCADKIGGVFKQSTCSPWSDFPVRDTWVTSLLAANKMTVESAKAAYISCVNRCSYNLQQLQVLQAERRKLEQDRRIAAIETELRKTLRPWKSIPLVDEWKAQYEQCSCRYRFLVLDGASCFGKTRYALSQNAPGATLYADCTAGVPLLREFDASQHKAILLDELAPKAAIGLKKLLQASNEVVVLGTSPTMVNAYTLHVHRVQIIVCTNVWVSGLKKLKKHDREWLEKNSYHVLVQEPMWQED